jgi:zinc transport system substrate-binding protein
VGVILDTRRAGHAPWLTLGVVAAVFWATAAVAGCSASRSSATPGRPRLKVVASLFPLAEVARQVGGSRITVTDLTPTGTTPRQLAVDSDQVAQVQAADVVIELGLGFQPAVENAAAGRANVVAVLPAIGGTDPNVWLDPVLMQQVVALVAQALQRADPAGQADYQRGARDFTAALGALDISYRSSLSDCAHHELVTPEGAFGRLSARYGLHEDAIGTPSPTRLAAMVDLVRSKHLTAVFTEPLVAPDAMEALAREAHVRTEVLDPIEGLTAGQNPAHATYMSLMTDNLATLLSTLGCSNSED